MLTGSNARDTPETETPAESMELSDFLPHFALALIGGLATSVGLGQLGRTKRGRAILGRIKGPVLGVVSVVFLAVSGGGLYWMIQRLLENPEQATDLLTPGVMLAFGLLVGLPFCLPTVITTWMDSRPGKKKGARTAPATRDDRRAFAKRLEDQIREVGEKDQVVNASVGGDGDRVLMLEGSLRSDQGERLVAALRNEMKDLGFKRVEGTGPGGKSWWAKV